jgi:hypothetical protein
MIKNKKCVCIMVRFIFKDVFLYYPWLRDGSELRNGKPK